MIVLNITPAEVESRQISPEHLATAVKAMRADGAFAMTGATDPEHIRILRDKIFEDLETCFARRGNLENYPDPPTFPPYLLDDILFNNPPIGANR